MRECLRDKPGALGIAFVDLDAAIEQRAADSLVAAAHAAAFALPAFKSPSDRAGTRLKTLRLHVRHARIDLATAGAQALGNNLARWFTALPPNVLTAAAYRDAIERLAPRGIRCCFRRSAAHEARSRVLGCPRAATHRRRRYPASALPAETHPARRSRSSVRACCRHGAPTETLPFMLT
jgi:hypothetical protein